MRKTTRYSEIPSAPQDRRVQRGLAQAAKSNLRPKGGVGIRLTEQSDPVS